MGTHNALLRLGEKLYLEVIAINPVMEKPQRPRWFRLDELAPDSAPRLATWVARCADIRSAHAVCGGIHGEIQPMQRAALNWQISIPTDGSMPFDGVAPSLIEWSSAIHPASGVEDRGCSLTSLKGFHPDAARLNDLLRKLGVNAEINVEEHARAHLVAEIQTPNGLRSIAA